MFLITTLISKIILVEIQSQITPAQHQETSHLLIATTAIAVAPATVSRITYFNYKFTLNQNLHQIQEANQFIVLFSDLLMILQVSVNF